MSEPRTERVLDALVDICGPDFARVGRSVDAVAGHRAAFVAVPATTRAVADTLRLAADHGLRVVVRGSGSKIDWGRPPPAVDLIVDTGRLSGMWNHDVPALTAEVATGTPVAALQAALALRGQRLPVDPPSRTATVGGMLAVNESGPLRYRFGMPAEHVDRVTYVDAAGRAAESDGEQGRPGLAEIDGVITSAVVRLRPLPAARRWAAVPVPNPLRLAALVTAASDLEPSGVEADLPADGTAGTLAALFEGDDEASVAGRAERLAGMWGDGATVAPIAPPWWGRYPFGRDEIALRLSVPAADLPAAIYALGDAIGAAVPFRGSAALGVGHAVLPGTFTPDRVESLLDTLRHVLMARNGRVVIVAAPVALARRVEMAARHDMF